MAVGINSVQDILIQWEAAGIFDYVLPFLLIFAVVFGVLGGTGAFGRNKGVNVIIAAVVALMSIRLNMVQEFFTEIFPRAGIGIAILIVIVVLVAAFIPKKHMTGWLITLYAIGGIIALMIVFNTFNALDWFGSMWWDDWGAMIIGALLIIGIIIAIVVPQKSTDSEESWPLSGINKLLGKKD